MTTARPWDACLSKNPPHFHVWYDDYQAEITIKNMTTDNPLLKVVAAEYVRDYTLRLTFNTGEVRLVDFTPLMQKGICRKLQDIEYFKSFHLDPFTVDWNDEIGFAPRYLYERGMVA